jgi:hypothetical protein
MAMSASEDRAEIFRPAGWEMEMDDRTVRLAFERHWAASDANDFEVEHEIYREDAVLDYPQSGERLRGRRNIQESRFVQPNKKRFTVRRIVGSGELWVTEFILICDGVPSYAVSIMELREGQVVSETQYFADPFDPAPSRARLVEREGYQRAASSRLLMARCGPSESSGLASAAQRNVRGWAMTGSGRLC